MFLITGLIVLLLVILIAQRVQTGQSPTINPVKYFENNSTPTPFNPQATIGKPPFTVGSQQANQPPIAVNDPVTIKFSQPVNNETLTVTINPQAGFLSRFSDDLTTLQIFPTNTWNYNTTYTVKVLNNTKSKDDQQLGQDYQFSFKTKPYIGI